MDQSEVFSRIKTEREYQTLKWGPITERGHEVGAWLTLMRTHLAQAESAWAENSGDYKALEEIRKVVAIGVACGEQHGIPERPEISLTIQKQMRGAKHE